MLVDSHCHLNSPEFDGRVGDILKNAAAAGVGAFLTIATTLQESSAVLSIAQNHDGVFASVGAHPHEATQTLKTYGEQGITDVICDFLKAPKIVALGESGLDYHYTHSNPTDQRRVFDMQLSLAKKNDVPIIVHTRDADDDTIDMLRAHRGVRGVIHCFTGTERLADAALELGLYISVSGIVTFKNAADIRAVIKRVPLDRLLVETDAPYLAPIPHRGQVNEPKFVCHTAQFLADLKGVSVETVGDVTTQNFFDLFTRARPVVPGVLS